MTQDMPGAAGDLARDHQEIWNAYSALGAATARAGGLTARERRLVKLALAIRKKVEVLFAHLKRILGLGRLRLRDPCGANDDFLLAATAQNLRKLAKIFPAPQKLPST